MSLWFSILLGALTFILFVDCLLLGLLILIQLPKKEAGIGTAFGGAATDALFGAGSGNALTKMTRYAATIFLGLAFGLSILYTHQARASGRALSPEEIAKRAKAAAVATPGLPATPTNVPQTLMLPAVTNAVATATNATTNAAPPTPLQTPAPTDPAAEAPAPVQEPEKKQ
jgi:protein translocase SecG subunit